MPVKKTSWWMKLLKGVGVGIAGAAAAGVAGSLDQIASAGTADLSQLKGAAIAGALTGITGWLLKSPLDSSKRIQKEAHAAENDPT